MTARASFRNEAATTGEHYRYLAPYREAGDDTTSEPETESGAFYARLHHERELNRAIRLPLFSNASHLTPGMVLETRGSDVPELKAGMVITLTTPPRPFLSSALLGEGAGRRHTTNPFPVPGKGNYRRPDIIIVKNMNDRWPGLAGPDTEGQMHADNLERLVEVKFPGDVLKGSQYRDYMIIVGRDRNRMTILEIHDCRTEEQQWSDQVVNVTMKAWKTSGVKCWPLFLYPPIFTPRLPATPAPAKVEPWTYAGKAVADLSEGAVNNIAAGWHALSEEMQQKLSQAAGWLNDSGEWVYSQGHKAWRWVSQTGRSAASWTDEQLRAAWLKIQKTTDMTLDMLKQVDWVQVLTDVAITVGVVLVAVGVGVLVATLGIPEALLAAFLLIVRLAITAWEALALVLGGTVVGTLATQ